jgi:DNA-binding phage protein
MLEGGHAAVHADEDVVDASQVRDLEKRVRDSERMLGRKTMEAEILRRPWILRAEKTDLALALVEQSRGRYPMSAIAKTLGVSRSNLIERASKPSRRRGSYRKPEDVSLLAELRPIIDQRPTYGYRRVTALLNRQWRKEGKPTVNTKRVLRVMQQNGLALQKHTALRLTRTHEGVVVAMRSNIRWCSDRLEPAIERSSHGRQWPMPASPARWSAI